MTGQKMVSICRTLGIGRSNAYRESQPRGARCTRRDDAAVTAQVRAIIRTRASYGARRVQALVNREFDTTYNLKRLQRVLELNGWKLPRARRRRTGRAHTGQIRRAVSNERWCSDGFEIACWNGEIVHVAFALDCHDRACVAVVAVSRPLAGRDSQQLMQQAVVARDGDGARPDVPIQWLTDNGSRYTALDTICFAERLHLVPITTPAASPQSNGMAAAFVNTRRRDYLAGADRSSATVVLEQMPRWRSDDNGTAPHSARGDQSPRQYRSTLTVGSPKGEPECPANWGLQQLVEN